MANKEFSLKVELKMEIDKFKKNMDRATAQNRQFTKQTQNIGKTLTASFAKVFGAIAAAKGAMVLFDKTMHSTQATGDLFDKKMEGLKGSVERFFEKVASGDLSNFTEDLQKAKRAAENFQVAMDELGDVKRALSVQKAENLLKIEELKLEVEKYKISDPDKARKAAQEIVKIAEEEIQKSIAASDFQLKSIRNKLIETYDISLKGWDYLLDYITNYDKLTESISSSDILNETEFEAAQKYLETYQRVYKANGEFRQIGQNDSEAAAQRRRDLLYLEEKRNDVNQEWLSMLPVLNLLTDKSNNELGISRDMLAEILIQRANEQRELVRREKQGEVYLRQLEDETTATEDLVESVEELTKARVNLNDLNNRPQYSPSTPTGSIPAPGSSTGTPDLSAWTEQMQSLQAEMTNMINYFITDSVSLIAEGLGEAMVTGDFQSYFDDILSQFGGFLSSIGGLMIAYAVTMDAFKKAFEDPWALMAAGTALLIIGGAIKGAHKNFASGSGYGGSGSIPSPQSQEGDNTIRFEIEGDTLVGVLDNHNRKVNNYQ